MVDRGMKPATRLASVPRKAGAVCACALLVFLAAGSSLAASKKSERSFVLTETTFKKMAKVWELAEAEDYAGAVEILKGIADRRSLKGHDKAVVFNTLGMLEGSLEHYPQAIEALEIALAENALPEATQLTTQYNLAQLYMAEEKYDKAIDLLQEWFKLAENPGSQPNYMMAAAYTVQERYKEALPYARAAVEKSPEPKENLLGLLLAVEYQNDHFAESLAILKQLTSLFPKKSYFMQLSYAFSNLGDDSSALAVLELAYMQGWLDKEKELISLAQRYYAADLPYKAAQVMQKGLDEGVIEGTSSNYELLANSLLNARERERSIAPMRKAAELAKNGELYVRLSQIYLEEEEWVNARKALELAIEKGDLKDPGNAQLLLGITHFNEKHYDSAKKAFQLALRSDKVSGSARSWLEHVDREIAAREAGLEN